MQTAERTSYDEVPYEGHPFPQTHPNRLATLATLLGLRPAPVDRCRVLELGCANGGNLIPMAFTLPESRFVGIDLSASQVAEGVQTVTALSLKNIELRHLSILDVGDALGRFDYIICHGVYSWVPAAVQDKLLDVCAKNLQPDGVAYVSYNTLPGWHMRGMIRDMMSYHARQFTEPYTRIQKARNLLDFLAESVAQEDSPYRLLLKNEADLLRRCRDSYLFHEHLEDVNEPIYFHQFADRAAAKGLRFLGEADFHVMVPGNYPPEVEKVLQQLSSDIIHIEQYMDFLRNRMFRQTLLCHADKTPCYTLRPEQMSEFSLASPARPVSLRPNLAPDVVEEFKATNDVTLKSSVAIVKSAMLLLGEAWPRAVPFDELCRQARDRLRGSGALDDATEEVDRALLGESLLRCYTSASTNLIELYVHPPRLVLTLGARPIASPLARLQAEKTNQLTNLRHELVTVSEFERHALRLLDGSRDVAALIDALLQVVQTGGLNVSENGAAITDPARLRAILRDALDQQLPRIVNAALLVG
jgi:methyltransferase-like protein/SAM-dependent methyltransferase